MDAKMLEDFIKMQAQFLPIAKTGKNDHFHNKFVPLADLMTNIMPILNENNFALTQFPCVTPDGDPGLRTTLWHKDGGNLSDVMPLMLGKNDPQGQGSAITYARRYALMAILGIVGEEDDDGNKTVAKKTTSSPTLGDVKNELREAIKAANANGAEYAWVKTATIKDIPTIKDHIRALKAIANA